MNSEMMHDLGLVLDPTKFSSYIDAIDSLPIVSKDYGAPYANLDHPYLMKYNSHLVGYIAFTRNTHKHPILKELCDKVVPIISNFVKVGEAIVPDRVHIIKTENRVPAHIDEGGRVCCINIGLKNSNTAITRFGNDNLRETFYTSYTDFEVEDGHAYLVNVSRLHAVMGSSVPRYLITYGFGETYKELLGQIPLMTAPFIV